MSTQGDKINTVEKEDLLRLLACLQSELEAREDVINALRLEKLNSINFRAKYGFGDIEKVDTGDSKDPFFALQRDSLIAPPESSYAEADLKPLYDTQLVQLENLITSQKRAQDTMREQLLIMESKYLKVCKELEDERSKHERDAAQGDDVLVMLEKERERLKTEVEYERSLNRKLQKDLRRALQTAKEQATLINSQKLAAVLLIKERYRLSRDRVVNYDKDLNQSADLTAAVSADVIDSPRSKDPQIGIRLPDESNSSGNTSPSSECVRLRKMLAEEITARKSLENRFERLLKEHHILLNTSAGSGSSALAVDQRNAPSDRPSNSSSIAVTSAVSTQRPKPNPPVRRSSGLGSPTNLNIGDSSTIGITTNEAAEVFDSTGQLTNPIGLEAPNASSTVPLAVNVSPNSRDTSPAPQSSSRSSTPSPPPPPPPIQLHYPYPGIQSHLHHGQSRNTVANPSFVPNTSRPLPGSAPKSRPAISSHPTSSYQATFVPLSQPQTNRMSFTPSSRGSVSRKPLNINNPSPADVTPNVSNYPVPFMSGQTKVNLVTQSQYPPRSTPQHLLSPSGHHFPAYPAVRQHTSGSPSTILNNSRAGRSSIPPTSALSSGGGPLGSGHVCINGK